MNNQVMQGCVNLRNDRQATIDTDQLSPSISRRNAHNWYLMSFNLSQNYECIDTLVFSESQPVVGVV